MAVGDRQDGLMIEHKRYPLSDKDTQAEICLRTNIITLITYLVAARVLPHTLEVVCVSPEEAVLEIGLVPRYQLRLDRGTSSII